MSRWMLLLKATYWPETHLKHTEPRSCYSCVSATRERERERESVCVYVCERGCVSVMSVDYGTYVRISVSYRQLHRTCVHKLLHLCTIYLCI